MRFLADLGFSKIGFLIDKRSLHYFLSENGVDPTGMVITVNPGDSPTFQQSDLGPSGSMLMARNTDPVNIAEYNVTVENSHDKLFSWLNQVGKPEKYLLRDVL